MALTPQPTLFTHVSVLDSTGDDPYPADVLVEDGRITEVRRDRGTPHPPGARVVDGGGRTLMSGLCDAHTHFSWNNAPGLDYLSTTPPEDHTLFAVESARTYLDCGYTMCMGASSAKPRLDVVIRDAINAGRFPGPRLRACCMEIAVSSCVLLPGASYVADGPDEFRKVVREVIGLGVDNVKLITDGEEITGTLHAEDASMSEEEIAVTVHEAHERHCTVSAHARSAESVKRCVRAGVDNIYHASFTDAEGMDLLEAAKDRVFVAPGINWLITTLNDAGPWGYTPSHAEAAGYKRELDIAIEGLREMHSRGIRVLPGGDYGFAWCPHSTYARDLQHFVDLLGFTPMEAILSATAQGGEIMGQPDELGKVAPGYLADLILVDGDPLADITVLQDRGKISAIMKDGVFHKEPA
ncbi:MAG: amidohydrolase family protein [Streptosporangiales bacterium]|nr:amidohydrolase family protein [Streptosporangiales bacterium]